MEGVLLNVLGGPSAFSTLAHPPMQLSMLDERVRFLQQNAIEKSTSKGYGTGARDYIKFCLSHNLPLEPTPKTLARYIAFTSQYIASGPRYLTGVRHFLRDMYPDFDENRGHPWVTTTIRGSKKVRGDPVHRKLPLRLVHLQTFQHRADESKSYDDILFATILSCCFYACHRSGELIQKNGTQLFDWRKVIKRDSLFFEHGRAQYRLPYHKSDPFYRGTDILFTRQEVADPVRLLHTYVCIRDNTHGCCAALFLREDGSHPTRSWFDTRFFALLGRDYGGHSLRAGGATFYASLGLSEDIIQAIGRWSSAAWKIYIRENPSIRAEQQLATLHTRLSIPHHSFSSPREHL